MKLKGTEFQIKVWKEILKIQKGSAKTYKEIANDLNKPKSAEFAFWIEYFEILLYFKNLSTNLY